MPPDPSSGSSIRNRSNRVRINPDTYIRLDGTDKIFIQNIHCKEGVSIKYDIMLILYEIVNWKTIDELLAPWPEKDQNKILDYLEMFHKDHIVVTSDEEIQTSESGLSEHLGSRVVIDVDNHHAMLRDVVRTSAYKEAIRRNVNNNSVVLDLGSGTGILSFFAAQSGAKKVYAIEKRPEISAMSQAIAEANGLDNRIEFIEGASSTVKESRLAEKPDVLVSEILGSGILEENILEFTIDARHRFLKPGGTLIPKGIEIYTFAYDSGIYLDREREVRELGDLYGFDLSIMGTMLNGKILMDRQPYNPAYKQMSDPVLVKTINLETMEVTTFSEDFEIEAKESGKITGFCSFFKAYLDDKVTLTNSPWAPRTHWNHLIHMLPTPLAVQKQQRVGIECLYDGLLRLKLKPGT